MSNFSPKLQDSTDDQLWRLINESSPDFASLASGELSRRRMCQLQITIETFNKEASGQTEKMIRLTWYIVVLTIVMVIGLVIQIALAL